jgi:hypothetical protein
LFQFHELRAVQLMQNERQTSCRCDLNTAVW